MHYMYKITNTINGKIYIGQQVDTNDRWKQHKSDARGYLKGTRKDNDKIILVDRKMAQYGIENFTFEIIASCKTQDDTNETETLLVKQYDCHVSNGKGYNVSFGGMNAPKSEKWKAHMSEITKQRFDENPEYKIQLLKANKQFKQKCIDENVVIPGTFQAEHEVKPEWIEAVKQAKIGQKSSQETLQKQSQGMKKAWADGKFDNVIHAGFTGSHTEETKQKISDAHKGKHHSTQTEFKKGHNLGKTITEKHRQNIIASRTRKTTQEQDQEIVEKYKNGQSIRSLAKEYKIDRKGIKNRIDG